MITFDPFWKTLKEKHITQYDLITKYNVSRSMLDKLRHNKSITLVTLNDLCIMLDCNVSDIIEFKKE